MRGSVASPPRARGAIPAPPVPPAARHASEPAQSAPEVSITAATAGGPVGDGAVRSVVSSHLGDVMSCYRRELNQRAGLEAEVTVRFSLAGGGDATVEGYSASGGAAHLARCATDAIRRWRFPPFDGGQLVHARVTLEFSPPDDPPGSG